MLFGPVEEGTRVDLIQRGWERLGKRAGEVRGDYDTGWEEVLGGYVRGCERTSSRNRGWVHGTRPRGEWDPAGRA